MHSKMLSAVTLVIAIALSSCNRNYVSLESTTAKGEVPQLGNLVFRFNRALYPDSLLNNWDSTEYISFTPNINGRFRWDGPDELVFSPAQPLDPATAYTASIHNDVLRYSQFNDIQSADKIRFRTAPLQLTDTRIIWLLQGEGTRSAVPQATFEFNYPVKAEDVVDKLSISIDGQKKKITALTSGSSQSISVRIDELKPEDRNYQAKLEIEKGLKPEKGNIATDEDINTELSIPSPYVLSINKIESEYDGTQGLVHVYTNQQLNVQDIPRFLKFSPAVKYSIESEDYGFTMRSEQFNADNAYTFIINMGLRGNIGGVLKEAYYGNVGFGEMESEVRFTNSKAVYLSKRGAGNIEVQINNTPKVKLVISKIYENNLLMAQRHGYEPEETQDESDGYSGDEEYRYDGYGYGGDGTAGDVVYSKVIDTRTLPKSKGGRLLDLSQFEDRLPDAKGIYHVMIRSVEDYWIRDSRFISFSDIGLIARQGQDRMMVFANSIKTAGSLSGITINVYGANNQLLGTGATNSDGAATINLPKRNFSGFRPAMIIAKSADDFTYLPFSNTLVNTSRFDVGGKSINTTGLDAFVYAERDIYRPGEKINFSLIVRNDHWKSPGAIPVKLRFLLPNGKELKTFRKGLNDQGATEGSIDIAMAAITGSYTLEVYSSNDILLSTKNFMVEEFVPDRIRVKTELDKQSLRPSEAAILHINAMNFFGPPAANRNYEMELQVHQKTFFSKKFTDYDFSLANQLSFFDKDIRQGKTDAAGNAAETLNIPAHYANSGLLEAKMYTTVFDETGRPVSRSTSVNIFTQDVYHGIKSDGYYYYALNQPVTFHTVSLDKDGNPVNAVAKVEIIKHDYRTVLTRNGSYFRYESQNEDRILSTKDINIGTETPITYIPRSPGDFEIRIHRPGANAYVSKHFYSYGAWGADNNSFEVNNEGNVDISLDKESYATGETAQVSFKAPFDGKLLVTVEKDQVISYQYIDVVKKLATIKLALDADHVPNVYISATLIKAHEASDIPLTVAHGFQSVKVEDASRRIPVKIVAAQSVRSRTHQKVQVKAIPGSYVSLAAVDNGVLQVSDFKTPDPYDFYYRKRALGVSAYDMYPLLFPEVRARLSSTGGDGGLEMDKRTNPVQAHRIKIMSYWSGLKKAGADGIVNFEFDVPQFSGELRLMAVAFRDDKFGSAEATTTVADPIVLSSALPRFVSPGDTVLVPVSISNTTGKLATGQISIATMGPVRVVGGNSQSVNISAKSEASASFRLVADPSIAVAKIIITTSALGEQFKDETEIAVRPPSTLQKLSGSGSIVAGQKQRVMVPQNNFLAGSFNYELVVSRSPVIELGDQMKYLLQYPYGCTEQTVSSAFPQLYYADFAELMKLQGKESANANIAEAIRKIKMRQLYNGGLTLWDGEGQVQWWTTVYAAHFLLEARKAGYDVESSLLETMLSFISNRLKTKETIDYYYNRGQRKRIAPKEVAYSLYVLALAGRPQVPVMNYYKANPTMLALDSKYLLSAAYAASGDKRSYTAMLPTSFTGEASEQETGGSFYSFLRDEAIALNALVDVDPGNKQIPEMARHVSNQLKQERYPNTQERAFAFLALGKLARSAGQSTATADISVNGKTIATVQGNWKGDLQSLKSSTVDIATKGSGRIYYTWVAEGISATGSFVQEDNYLKVRRRFLSRSGTPISGNTFRQNDLVVVEITLEKAYNSTIENVVITDLLPAGFEIENPRIKELPGMDWIRDNSEPTALDIRDDRIHFFVDAYSGRQKYYYVVRAVSLGNFKQGPVSADAMYNGEMHSYNGAQLIRVVK